MTALGDGWRIGDEDFVAGVLRVTAQPIWVVDPGGRIRFANPAAVQALGYDSPEELLGRQSHETIHYERPDGSPYPASECPMLLPRSTGETVRSDLDWFFRRDGSMFPVSYVSAPINMPEGRGAVVAFTDIEERRLAEQFLREREAMLAGQQDALRRVAALVARDAASADVFAAVAREVGQVLGTPLVQMSRYEPDGTATVLGAWSERPHPFQAGTRWPLEGPTISLKVRETGRPARLDDLAGVPGALAEAVRGTGIRSVAGAPIVVRGRVWGVMATGSTEGRELPSGVEHRLAEFTELVGTAIANTQAREELRQLAEEQAALRRVATLVAQGAPPGDVFAAVAAEVAQLLGITRVVMCRYDSDNSATAIGAAGDHPFRPGTNWPLDGPSMMATVRRTGRPARIDDYSSLRGRVAQAVRTINANAGVSAPIIVDGDVWGVVSVGADSPLPAGTEDRLSQFTDLVATAISKTQASDELRRLAEEQAGLRRVATLVAEGAPPADVFGAVAAEVSAVLDLPLVEMCRYEPDGTATVIGAFGDHPFQTGTNWTLDGPSLTGEVKRTGRPARVDNYADVPGSIGEAAKAGGVHAGVGAPIVVDGDVWGIISAGGGARVPLLLDAEARLSQFTELVATAISNAQAQEDLHQLADEQAALRRVATLVAQGAPPADVFGAVAAEVAVVLDLPHVDMCRYEPDGTATVIGAIGDSPVRVGTNWTLDGPSLTAQVNSSGLPARVDDYADVPGSLGDAARAAGVHAGVGAPIVVDGKIWGVVSAASHAQVPLPSGAETRLSQFTSLVAAAISNTQAREDVERLADEQAALRRIATLVAQGAESQLVFDAVCEETGRVFGAATANLAHFTPDGINLTISGWSLRGVHGRTGTRLPIDGDSINAIVQRTGAPGRCDSYEHAQGEIAALMRQLGVRSEVGAPVVVDGQVWGVLIAGTDEPEPLAPGTEYRLSEFAELIATAVSNTQARQDLRRLVDEQAALRWIATLVARGAQSQTVFDAVCEETGRLFGAATVNLVYFTPEDFHLAVAGWSLRGVHVPAGTLLPLKGETIDTLVRRTAAPGRFDSYEHATGELAALIRKLGIRSEVGAPVVVDGEVWGVLIAGTDEPEPLPAGTEQRLASFAELIATAVSNTTARSELIASRARIVSAGDEQRRRVVRDLHDGAQQRLVHGLITLQLAQSEGGATPELRRFISDALDDTRRAIEELRELAHGLHPAVLTARGLAAAVEELADRAPVPVHVDIPEQRFPAAVESAAYFIAAEALTNVAKYANASAARVAVTASGDSLVLTIADDGAGGAMAKPGTGLSGLRDRVAALDGTLRVDSPPGAGTRIRAEFPLRTVGSPEADGIRSHGGSERPTAPIAAPD